MKNLRLKELHRIADNYEALGHSVEIVTGLHACVIVTMNTGVRFKVSHKGRITKMLNPVVNFAKAA